MDRTQKNLKLLAVVAYAVMAAGLILGTSYATLIMVAILVAAVVISKQTEDDKAILPVVGAQVLYFAVKMLEVVFGVISKLVAQFEAWGADEGESLENLYGSLLGAESSGSDTMNEIFDFIVLLVAVVAIVFAVIAVINVVSGKDFSKSIVGKIAAPFAVTKEVYYCANCGAAVKGGFCGKCGTKKPE